MFPGTAGRGRGGSGPPSSGRSSLAPGSGRPSLGSGRPSVGMQPFAAPGRRPSAAPSAGGGSRRSSVAPSSGRGPPSSNASPRGSSAGSDLGAAYYQSGHPTSEKSTEFIGTQLHAIQQELAQRKADSQRMREELAQPLSTVPTAEDYAHYTAVKQQMELQHHNAMTAEQRRHVDLTRSWTQAYEARKKQLDRILPDDNMWLSPDAVDVELHRALQSRTAMLATADPAAVPKRTFKGSSKLARLLIRYPALERYHHGEVDWLSFWVNDLGGLRGMGPGGITEEELTLIVATDERTVYRLPVPPQARQVGNQLAPPPPTPPLGFFEVILSQLPNLLRCSLRASRYDFSRLDCMARAPRPFPSLCTLDLSGTAINTTQLQDLSRWMAHPELLFELSLANCHGITDLSKALLAFEGLKRLDLSGSGVDSLAWLVTSCPKLKSLDLRRCASLKKLSGLSAGPRRLRRLALSCINGVLDVSWVSSTTPTEYLTVEDCNSTVDYKTLRGLYRLKFLSLTCEGNIPLRWIASCQLLTCVYVFFNSPVTGVLDLAPFAELRSLTTLYLRGSDSMDLSMLSTASKVPTIEELHITGNAFVTDLEPLRRLSSLQRLYVTYAGAVELLQLSGCVSLVELYISCTEELSGFHHLRNLRLLRKLCIRSPEGVDLGSGIEHLSTLEELDLSGCPLQQNLRPISRIKSLRRLHVGGTPEERDSNLDFKMLKSLSHLTVLGVSGAALNKKSRKQLDLE